MIFSKEEQGGGTVDRAQKLETTKLAGFNLKFFEPIYGRPQPLFHVLLVLIWLGLLPNCYVP